MSAVVGITLLEGELRTLPKYGLNMNELVFCFGSLQLVRELRDIGALVQLPGSGRQLFDAEHVAEVWARFRAGEFQAQLERSKR